MDITLSYCQTKNGIIGVEDGLPYCIPPELSLFSRTSKYQIVVMGRKTWESPLVSKTKLKDRANFVLTKRLDSEPVRGVKYFDTPEKIVEHIARQSRFKDSGVFVVGGKETLEAFLPFANRSIVTTIYATSEGSCKSPEIDYSEWDRTSTTNYMSHVEYRVCTSIYRRSKPVKH